MNKAKFMSELEKRLKYLPKEDRDDAISYYTEYINDMNLEESDDVENKLGNPKEIAAAILADCTEKQLNDKESKKGVKSSARILLRLNTYSCCHKQEIYIRRSDRRRKSRCSFRGRKSCNADGI